MCLYISDELCARTVQLGFFTEYRSLEKRGASVEFPPTLPPGKHLVLHDGGRGAKIKKINIAAHPIGEVCG